MRARRARWLAALWLGFVVLGLALLTRVRVEAGCNAIPPAARRYPSTNGLVNRRLVAPWTAPNPYATPGPDDVVEIELPAPCAASTFAPGVSVEIQFLKPVPGATASPSWMQVTTDRLLRFTVPDTNRAGPVNIVVTDAAKKKIAEVGPLYQETSSCLPGPPEETFGQLTVLPVANDVRALAAGTAPLVMTVDGNGGLLVPLAHPFPVPTAEPLGTLDLVAFLERGVGDFQALNTPMKTLTEALKMAQKPGDETLSHQLVRTFTEHGRPLPVLVHIDSSGAVWGSVDVARSVLRVAPRDAASNPIQDLAQHLDPQGRVVVTPKPVGTPRPFAAATSNPFLLADLRSRDPVVAWARDERIEGEFDGMPNLTGTLVQTVRAAHAGRNFGFGMSPVSRDGTGRARLGTGDVGGAFLESENMNRGRLRAYTLRATGTPIPRATPAADLRSKINRRGLAMSGSLVFFGKYKTGFQPQLQSFDLDDGTSQNAGIPAFGRSEVGNGCSVSVAAKDREASWYCWAKNTPNAGDFGVVANDVAIAGRLAVVAARPSPSPAVLLEVLRPVGSPSPRWRIPQAATAVGATGYCDQSHAPCDDAGCPSGQHCVRFAVLLAPPAPSASAGMLSWVAEPTPGATPVPSPVQTANDFVARGGIIAFRSTRASGIGNELFTLDLRQRPPRLCSTGSTATTPGAVDWMDFYEIRGDDVLFLTNEQEEGRDLDGDHKLDHVVLQMFNVEGCNDPNLLGSTTAATVTPLASMLAPADVEPGTVRVDTGVTTSTLFADEEGDGVVYPFDRCVAVANPRQIDDDLDGLGDGAASCDPTYCTPYQPPPVHRGGWAGHRCRARIRTQARRYLADRAEVVRLCLPTVAATGTAVVDERARDVQCRGTFAYWTENPPAIVRAVSPHAILTHAIPPESPLLAIATAVHTMVDDETELRDRASASVCDDRLIGSRVVRASAEAVAAVTRAAAVLGANTSVTNAVTAYLRQSVVAMDDCLDRCRLFPRRGAALAAECFGHLGVTDGQVAFVPPTHHRTAQRLAAAQHALVSALGHADCAMTGATPCGSEMACLGWRRAVDVVNAMYAGD